MLLASLLSRIGTLFAMLVTRIRTLIMVRSLSGLRGVAGAPAKLAAVPTWPPAIDCQCYHTDNFFVDDPVLGPSHFTYNGESEFREAYAPLLVRLSEAQQTELIDQLEAEADRRRQQPTLAALRKARVQSEYNRLHPGLWSLSEQWLHPQFVELVRGCNREGWRPPPSVAEGVYKLPVFSERFCELLCEELKAFQASGLPCGRPNSMNRLGALLDELGFYPGLLDPLLRDWLTPLCKRLPALVAAGGAQLDGHKSFVVAYRMGEDEKLQSHYDNSEVTLNANLGISFEAGELCFYGHKETASASPIAYHEWCDEGVGHAVLHLGAQVHSALPITDGERVNLVMWMRSTAWRKLHGCPMCGETSRLVL